MYTPQHCSAAQLRCARDIGSRTLMEAVTATMAQERQCGCVGGWNDVVDKVCVIKEGKKL